MSSYSKDTYIAALRYFGYKASRAEIIYKGKAEKGILWELDHLVRQYNFHRGLIL